MNLDSAVQLATKNLAKHGLSDISSAHLEKQLISNHLDEFQGNVRSMLNRGSIYEMEFKPVQFMLTPKNRFVFDYRRAAIIEPSCLAKYTSLVLMLATEIERHRIPTTSQTVFSARFRPTTEDVFDPSITYSTWRERTKTLANSSECSYVVQCDIAAFYDRINIHRIESTLDSIGVEKSLRAKINDLLLFWTKKDSYGLPVGNVASRILAEAALIDIDNYLIGEAVVFTRYVDDYRLFAPDIVTAQRWMNKLNTRLFRDGLMLNTGKTKLAVAHKDDTTSFIEDLPEAHDAEAVLRVITKLTGGYNRIARTFFMPASDKFDPFRKISIGTGLEELGKTTIVDFTSIQKLVIACIVQERFDLLVRLAEACGKYMYALDYFVDMLIKNAEAIPSSSRNAVADYYAGLVMRHEFYAFEWHEATIAKLLSSPSYFRKPALLHIFKHASKEMVTYPSTIALEGLYGNLTRTEFKTIREWFDRCDDWEKRRIIHLSNALPEEERKAWAKAIKPSLGSDTLGKCYVDTIIKGHTTLPTLPAKT